MDFSTIVSEEKIRRAYQDGEFTNLPGFGKPLELEDLSSIPEDLRMAYKVLKNAGYTVEENKLKQEMMTVENLIRNSEDPEEKLELKKKLNEKMLRFNGLMSKRRVKTNSSNFNKYESKINDRLLK